MKHAYNQWQVGDVRITRVVEAQYAGVPPGFILADAAPERVQQVPWLLPHYASADGSLTMSVHAYVIESQGRKIIVDTCAGNDKARSTPLFDHLNTPFLDHLRAAGHAPETIDTVLCTHLHIDHVGWNTRLEGDRWVPTFSNARYLFARAEWEHWSAEQRNDGDASSQVAQALLDAREVMRDSLQPIIDAGLQQLVEPHHVVTGEVQLTPTPGHTPGHVSVLIESAGERAIILGDLMHHPFQMCDPSVRSLTDSSADTARRTRSDILQRYADSGVLVLGTHFATPAAGRIVSDGVAWRFDIRGQATTE